MVAALALAISGLSFVETASAVPVVGGPSIRDVAVDDQATATPDDDIIYVAFDNPVAGVALADFVSTGASLFDGATAVAISGAAGTNGQLVTLTNLTRVVTASDSVALSARGVISAVFPTAAPGTSHDVTPHRINTGPILVTAFQIAGLGTDTPVDDVLLLSFNVPVEGNTGGVSVNVDDFIIPQLTGGEAAAIGDDDADNQITVAMNDAVAPTSGHLRIAATHVRLNTAGATPLRSVANDVFATSQVPVKVMATPPVGPFLVDATYNPRGVPGPADDELVLVFSEDLDISATTSLFADLVLSSGALSGTETITLNGNVVRIAMNAASTPPGGAAATANLAFPNTTLNRAGVPATPNAVTIDNAGAGNDKGPIIVSASVVPGGIAGAVVTVEFSEGVLDASLGTIDFAINGDAAGVGISNLTTGTTANDRFVMFEYSPAYTDLSDGDYVELVPANVITSAEGSAFSATSSVNVAFRDGRAAGGTASGGPPITLVLGAPNTFEENPGGGISIAHLAWTETAGTDTADYYLLFTRVDFPVDSTYVANNLFKALPVSNPTSRTIGSGAVVGDRIIRASVAISPGDTTTEGTTIVVGSPINFGIVAVTCDNKPAPINASGSMGGLAPGLEMIAGEVQAPIDFIVGVDTDMMRILGHKSATNDSVQGDSACVEADARVLAFTIGTVTSGSLAADSSDTSLYIGSGQANSVGQVAAFNIGDDHQDPATGFIYLYAIDQWGNLSTGSLALLNDNDGTGLNTPPTDDPFTPNMIYADGDSIVIVGTFRDTLFAATPVLDSPSPAIVASADFSQIDTGTGSDNVPFINHGTDGIDNDGDWDSTIHDLGLDGAPGTTDAGEGDGLPTPGEYFCDIGGPSGVGAGDGVYTLGEPFTDTNANKQRDVGEPNIDLNDSDEYGWYSTRWTISAATSVTDSGQVNFLDIKNLPVVIMTTDCFENMTLMDGTDPFNRFLIELDNLAPSVSEILTLEQEATLVSNAGTNIVTPGQNCYPMGEFIDLTVTTPSDLDVDFVRLQISVNGGSYFDMSYDPNGDSNGDGYPGEEAVDDDRDGVADSADVEVAAAIANVTGDGVDNDNDGQIDESTTDGIDNDDDGTVDNGTEVETYNPALDDNEDGIEDGVDTGTGRALNPQPHILDAGGLGVPATTFDFFAINGFNIDMRHIRNLYGITDADQINLRAVAYDMAGGPFYGPPSVSGPGTTVSIIRNDQTGFAPTANATPAYAAPICFTTNLSAPVSSLPASVFTDIDAGTAGTQICDAKNNFQGGSAGDVDETGQIPANPDTLTLTANVTGSDVVEVVFYVWNSTTSSWLAVGNDVSGPPFTTEWSPGLVDNDPAARVNHFFLTTTAEDLFGNVEDLDRNGDGVADSLDAQVEVDVVDCVAPKTNLTRIGIDSDLSNGAIVPIQAAVEIEIGSAGWSDRDEIHMYGDASGGNLPGIDGFDDDGDGTTDERDFGFDREPGTADDEWGNGDDTDYGFVSRAGLGLDRGPGNRTVDDDALNGVDNPDYGADGVAGTADDEFLRAGTDDFLTNDIIRVDFQMRPVGSGGPWTTIQSITGTIVGGNVSDLIPPLVVTWDVTSLSPGDYDVRAVGFDIEGNTNDGTAFITTAKVNPIGLRAYIVPPVPAGPPAGLYTLYAHTYIHDILVDHVDFQFYEDDNGDGIDNDGNDWVFIGNDDNDGAGFGGDVLLRAGSAAFDPTITGGAFSAMPASNGFLDLDGDGYSSRDPIVEDDDLSGTLSPGDDDIIGDTDDIPTGTPITFFPADHFYVDNGNGDLDAADWIYQENANAGVFDLWTTGWDARGLSGSVLVRAVATNEVGAVDDTTTTEPGVIPVESVDIDDTAPCATISGITLQDGTFEAPQGDTLDVDADNAFIKISATVTDTDVDSVRFEWSVNGGTTWMGSSSVFDVNDDGDFYSDIDGTPGFSSGDEIFFDADGDFTYSSGDVATRFSGTLPVTPIDQGWPILPLLGEDPAGSGNSDGDNQTDEDGVLATSLVAPHMAFLDLDAAAAAGFFATDTQILLRAVAVDVNGNVCPTPTFFKALVHERRACRVDAIVATTASGDTVDILSAIADGDGGDQLGDDTLNVFATANDSTSIVDMRIYYRKHPSGYPGLNVFNNPWVDAGISDAVYPYNLSWDIGALPDGCYQFFVACEDDGGNVTDAPANPYEFSKLTVTASVTKPESVISVFPGDEVLFEAELSDPNATAHAEVTFYYAERILDEVVSLTASFPYVYTLSQSATPDPDGTHTTTVDVTINGTPATYHTPSDFADLTSPTLSDFTITGSTLRMGGQQSSTDNILISYNVTSYDLVDFSGDREAPFTARWDFRTGGVPAPTVSGVNAYDLIATVYYNYFDPFFTSTPPTPGTCLFEEDLSEGRYILVLNAQGPCPFVHGVHRDASDGSYLYDFNAPGNPMCLTGDKLETGLAGKEIDVFITVTDSGGSGVDSVYAFIDAGSDRFDFALYSLSDTVAANDSISLPITMYITDYTYIPNSDGAVLNPSSVENVQLRYTPTSVFDDLTSLALVMYDDGTNGGDRVAGDGCYTATPRLALGSTYRYRFDIDLVGDQQYFLHVADARNRDTSLTPLLFSSTLQIPSEFWYHHFDLADAAPNNVLTDGSHSLVAWAVDNNGNRRSNISCPQGRLMFIVDMIAPVISMIDITPDVLNVCDISLGENGHDECCLYTISAMIPPNPASIPALGVTEVHWQFSPDNGIHWFSLGIDSSATNGWAIEDANWDWDPMDDDIDNDGDGYFDEGDNVGDGVSEEQVEFQLRALAIDDCGNIGFSQVVPFTIDTKEPSCELVTPADGTLFPYGDEIQLCATSPDAGHLSKITFQYMDNSGLWTDIDWTPQDASDPDYVPAPDANAAQVCVTFDTDVVDLEGQNPFLWLRCVAADSACNEESDPTPILVQLYDASAPSAWISYFNNDCMPVAAWDAHLAVDGDNVDIVGVVVDPVTTTDVAKVTAQVEVSGTFQDIGTDFAPFTGLGGAATDSFVVVWDTTPLANGTYVVRVVATDTNGNSDTSAVSYNVRVDHTDPTVPYTNIVFIDTTVSYANDDVFNQSSLVVRPDDFTGDVAFRVITPDSDIKSMTLQYRLDDPTDPGDWASFPVNSNMDFEANRSSTGAYFWWTVVPNWADTLNLADGKYQFRVLATDYACNTNALATTYVAATIDKGKPTCMFFGNDAVADGTIGNIAAGEVVTLNLEATDAQTDVANVWYDWSFDGTNWERISGEDAFTANNIDTDHASWTSVIDWTTPAHIVRDKVATVRAHLYDSAGDTAICTQTILIEDKTPPENTRIFDIASSDGSCDVYPRNPTETTLMVGTTINNAVTITAATAVGDSGIAEVHFQLSSNGGASWFEIGVDQTSSTFTTQFGMVMPIWSINFDSEALDTNGNRATPDGTYLLRAWAKDLEENYEVLGAASPMRAPIVIDTEEPTVKMNALNTTAFDPTPQTCETTVERGSVVNVGGQTIVSPTNMTPTTNEDVTVTFWYMNAKDQPWVADAWKVMNRSNGIYPYPDPFATDNPDSSRPYSFYWSTALDSIPLTVGGSYNVVATGSDIVCNSGNAVDAWMAGLGTCFTVTDTTAPCATLVYLDRVSGGGFRQWPDYERVNRISSLTAAILRGDTDTERVDFYYRAVGSSTWILADGTLSPQGGEFYDLNNWTSDNLPEGIYEFAANGIDDAGNIQFDPADNDPAPCSITHLIIDRTAPVATAIAPVDSQTCRDVRYHYDNDGDPYIDVTFSVDLNDVVFENEDDNDQGGITLEWKYSSDPDLDHNWDSNGFGPIIYDRSSNRFYSTFSAEEPADDIVDFRVTLEDSAGNVGTYNLATWVVLDTNRPEVNITRITNLTDQSTFDGPFGQTLPVDITAGDPIRVWVTARDNGSQWVPGWASCGVDSVFFEIQSGEGPFMPLNVGATAGSDSGAFYIDWNTTGLSPGVYAIRAFGADCCGNVGFSEYVLLNVESNSPPKVAVVCFDPDVLNDITGRTKMRVYAREWCDQEVDKVIFEYRDANGPGSTDWIPFGFTEQSSDTDSLWFADLDLTTTTSFALGDTIRFRGVAIKYEDNIDDDDDDDDDDDGSNRTIRFIDENPVVTMVTLERNPLGTRDLRFEVVRTTPQLVNFDAVELVPDTHEAWYIQVSTNAALTVPWVTMVAENDITQEQWEETIRLYRSPSDPLIWRAGATKEVLRALCDGGTITFCAAALDSAIGRVDIDDWSTRAYKVTNTFGSNGPVSLAGDPPNAITVDVPRGNGLDGVIVLSPTIEPAIEEDEDQSLFIDMVEGACWDIRIITECAQDYPKTADGTVAKSNTSQGQPVYMSCEGDFDEPYPAKVTVTYNDAGLDSTQEQWIIPAWHDGNDNFHYDEIYDVEVDTEANTVTFRSENFCDHNVYCLVVPKLTAPIQLSNIYPWCYGYTNDRPIINATLTDIFTSGEPGDAEDDDDGEIDPGRIRVWIDGNLWGSTDREDDDDDGDWDAWARGNGIFFVEDISPSNDIYDIKYVHSTLPEDALAAGAHKLTIQFAAQLEASDDGDGRWYSWEYPFQVDVTPPFAKMDGGTVASPVLRNVAGYIDAREPALTARLWDLEAGVFARPNHQDPILNVLFANLIGGPIVVAIPPIFGIGDTIKVTIGEVTYPVDDDMGLKMDVWLVDQADINNSDGEDDQDDIDEFFERNLIQAGTPDMLRYTPPLRPRNDLPDTDSTNYYTPDDTLTVRFPITVDLSRYDGREIEVVLYSAKVEHIGHDIQVPDIGSGGDDEESEEFTKYLLGAFDCVGNVGSQYVAARYIIDASAPRVAIVSPGCDARLAPGADFNVVIALTDQGTRPDVDNDGDGLFGEDPEDGIDNDGDWVGRGLDQNNVVFYIDDTNRNGRPDPGEPHVDEDPNDAAAFTGSGIDTSSVDITIVGPDDEETTCPVNSSTFQNGTVRCTVDGPHAIGDYTITVSGRDQLGNQFSSSCNFQVENPVLSVFTPEAYPNPFDNETENVTIRWEQSREGRVTVEIYDFAGDFVDRVVDNVQMTPAQASAGVTWGGSAEDGSRLANGGYLVHITVDDGARSQSTDARVAIRRDSGD
jgi:hypothetical protein